MPLPKGLKTGLAARLPGSVPDYKPVEAAEQRELFRNRKLHRRVRKGVSRDTNQRSLDWLRKQGFHVETTQHTKVHLRPPRDKDHKGKFEFVGSTRVDLWGFMDIMYFSDGGPLVAVQCCPREHVKQHLDKFRSDRKTCQAIRDWLSYPGREFVIHSWDAFDVPTKAGGTKRRWEVRVTNVTLAEMAFDEPF